MQMCIYAYIHICPLAAADSPSGPQPPKGKETELLGGNKPEKTKKVMGVKYSKQSSHF